MRSPSSFAQQRLWFLSQLDRDGDQYNIARALHLRGSLDVTALRWTLDQVVARHESLRTILQVYDGDLLQVVAPAAPVPLAIIDLSSLPVEERRRLARGHVQTEAHGAFDLGGGPLFRCRLLRLGGPSPDHEEHVLTLVFHHAVFDGWSLGVLYEELSALYAARLAGRPNPLPPLAAQYRDYANWQHRHLSGAHLEQELAHWRGRLAGVPTLLDLPTDRPRPPVQAATGAEHLSRFPEALWEEIRAVSRRREVTPFMSLLAGYAALLGRLSRSRDLVIGTPIAGRTRAEFEPLIGFFANTLPLRVDLGGDPSFGELLGRVRLTALEAYAHQEVPFQKLVEELRPQRATSHQPLVQAMFTTELTPPPMPDLAGLEVEAVPVLSAPARLDLSFTVRAVGSGGNATHGAAERFCGHEIEIVYSSDLFDRATIERTAARYTLLLAAAVKDPQRRLSELPILDDTERRCILSWGHQPGTPPDLEPVHATVARRSQSAPDAIAVVHDGRMLSYGELDRRANRLAHSLRGLGAGPERVVGVLLPRGIDLVVALLGVLRAGAAYLALDIANPPRRSSAMLGDAGASILVTAGDLADGLIGGGLTIVDLAAPDPEPAAADPPARCHPGTLAYVVYTSGSTGSPKGVMIEHRSLANMVDWHRRYYELGPSDRTTMFVAPSFDFSAAEIWPSLTAGSSIFITDPASRLSAEELREWLLSARITVGALPVPLAESLLAPTWPAQTPLRVLITGGERLRARPHPALPFRLVNNYGPTESTVVATAGVVEARDETSPPIGRPVAGIEAYVLDGDLRLAPLGAPGELHLGGPGLSRGYLRRPDATADHFRPSPFSAGPGARLYRTGDLVRWRPDGSLEFLGRTDEQVKIRGHRIEPAEIEAALAQHPDVADAHVATYHDPVSGDIRLAAYVTPSGPQGPPAPAQLGHHLSHRLPRYMLPHAYLTLDQLPLTPHGKIVRNALPDPAAHGQLISTHVPARSDLERRLVHVWQQLLSRNQVGVHDNFFDLGGHSLMLASLRARVADAVGSAVPIVTLFEHPTIAALAAHLAGEHDGPRVPAAVPAAPGSEDGVERWRDGRARLRRHRQLIRESGEP